MVPPLYILRRKTDKRLPNLCKGDHRSRTKHNSVIVCTGLWGKELHRQVCMGIVVTSGSVHAQNARDVSLSPTLGMVFSIFITQHWLPRPWSCISYELYGCWTYPVYVYGLFSEKMVQKCDMIVKNKLSTNDPYVTHIKDMVPEQHILRKIS